MSNTICSNGHVNYDASIYTRENAEKAMRFLENNNLKAIDADTFERIKDLLDKMEVDPNSKIQGPLKTVLMALSLAGASALTASAVTAKGLTFLQKNTKLIDNAGKYFVDLLAQAKKSLKNNPNIKAKSFKGAVVRFVNNSLNKLDAFSKKAVKEQTKGIKGPGSVAKKATEQGKYLVNRTIQTTAATVVGGKTLKETTIDKDKNGIADFQEKGKQDSSSVTQKLAEAIIATAV